MSMDIQGKNIVPNVTVVLAAGDTVTSDETLLLYQWICHCFLSQVICVFGTVTNIINIGCFAGLGFQDPVNITLFGLAMSDLGSLVSMIWLNVCMTPVFRTADLPFAVDDMLYLLGGWPHATFSRITSFLTAFLTLERCLSIAIPLQVKRIFTSKRVAVFVATFFTILLVSVAPVYCVTRVGTVFVASRNKTIVATVHTDRQSSIYTITLAVNNVIIPFAAFAMVIICTAILIVSLRSKTQWRQSAAVANSEKVFQRDQKVSKMILIIATVFIICFIPSCLTCLAITIEPQIDMYGRYRNTCLLLFGLIFTLESANSSVNIFIYYTMSSKFRAKFRELFNTHLK